MSDLSRRKVIALGGGLTAASMLPLSLTMAPPAFAKITGGGDDLYETEDLPKLFENLRLQETVNRKCAPVPESVKQISREEAAAAVSEADARSLASELSRGSGDAIDSWNVAPAGTTDFTVLLNNFNSGVPAGFIVKLVESHPLKAATSRTTAGSMSYTVQSSYSHSVAVTNGWSLGGTGSLSITPDGGNGGISSTFSFSQSITVTDTTTVSDGTTLNLTVPSGAMGWIEARFNGGRYRGWVVHEGIKGNNWWAAKPVEIFVKSPRTDLPSAVTWVRRGERSA